MFFADRDYTHSAPPIPGMGTIVCHKADALTSLRAAKSAVTILRWLLEVGV